jgi:hypothetical protein
VAARFAVLVTARGEEAETPSTTEQWLALLVEAVSLLPPQELGLLLEKKAFGATVLADLWSEDEAERTVASGALAEILSLWIAGAPLSVIGGAAHGEGAIEDPRRGQMSPLPRTIRLVDQGIGFGLTRAAGLLAAVMDVGVANGAVDFLDDHSREQLGRLAVVLRLGANGPAALALMRAGARPRAIGHLLAQRLPPPDGGLTEESLRAWAADQLKNLPDELEDLDLSAEERQLVAAFLIARDAR